MVEGNKSSQGSLNWALHYAAVIMVPNNKTYCCSTEILKYKSCITVFMKDIITIRGDRELWLDFVCKVKKEKRRTWDVLSPLLKKFCLTDEKTRVLLILFPKELIEQLKKLEDPDRFVEEAIRIYLEREK